VAGETGSVLWRMALWDFFRKLSLLSLAVTCLVPVRGLPMPSRSMDFGDVSKTNGRETKPRTDRVKCNGCAQ